MDGSSVLQGPFEPNEEKYRDEIAAPGLPIYDMTDLGDLALLKAALDGEDGMAVDEPEPEAGAIPLNDSRDPTPDFPVQIESDINTPSSEILVQVAPTTRIEVAIPELTAERRIEYSAVHSRVVERLADVREYPDDYIEYDVEFTDGRIDTVRLKSKSVFPRREQCRSLDFPEP
jgi:hypothetical protein